MVLRIDHFNSIKSGVGNVKAAASFVKDGIPKALPIVQSSGNGDNDAAHIVLAEIHVNLHNVWNVHCFCRTDGDSKRCTTAASSVGEQICAGQTNDARSSGIHGEGYGGRNIASCHIGYYSS